MSETTEKPTGQEEPEGPKPGSDEYNQQMADRFKGQEAAAEAQNQSEAVSIPPKPEGGHDKYYNTETGAYNWEAHAKELEYNASGRNKDSSKEGDPKTPDGDPADADAREIVQGAGLNTDEVIDYINEHGTISDEHRAVLKEKANLSDELIDGFIEGKRAQAALAEQQVASAIDYAGGEQGWNALSEWAIANLSDQQKEYVNGLLDSSEWKQGIDQLRQWQGASSPAQRGNVIAADGRSSGVVGYESRAEMKADINSSEYRTSPAFREQVRHKIAVSKFEGDATL